MSSMIFINLPVTDLARSRSFYEALGFVNNPAFSDEAGACMVLSDVIHVMLLTQEKWRGFTTRPICPRGTSEVSLAFTCESRDAVNRLVETGAAHGGTADVNPPEDHGFMFQRTICDPDDHIWEPFWMDPAAAPGAA
jgi:predicted lactoylglutathione lyase